MIKHCEDCQHLNDKGMCDKGIKAPGVASVLNCSKCEPWGTFCPKCGRYHRDEVQNWINGKSESVIVCDCGYTSFVEIYRQRDFMDP